MQQLWIVTKKEFNVHKNMNIRSKVVLTLEENDVIETIGQPVVVVADSSLWMRLTNGGWVFVDHRFPLMQYFCEVKWANPPFRVEQSNFWMFVFSDVLDRAGHQTRGQPHNRRNECFCFGTSQCR